MPCVQIIARQRFGALERQLRARFAGGQRKLLLLKAIKGAILAARQPQSGECRVKRNQLRREGHKYHLVSPEASEAELPLDATDSEQFPEVSDETSPG